MPISNIANYFVPEKYAHDKELGRKSKFIVWFVFITSAIGIFFSFLISIQNPSDTLNMLGGMIYIPLFIFALFHFKKRGSFIFTTHFICGIFFLLMCFMPNASGGIFSPDMPTLYILPIFALIMGNYRIGLFYAILTSIIFVIYYILGVTGHDFYFKQTILLTADYFFFNILLNFAVISFLVFRNENLRLKILEELKGTNRIISQKSQEITDSINYAKRIQQAKLPRIEDIKQALPESFVLFKPKDIVSGDFYYFKKKNDLIFIAAADCTGHGVPGAVMSMICSEKLEEAVANNNNTSDILRQVNRSLKATLRQSESEDSTRDGMDIVLCVIDPANKTISYCGANRPILFIRKGQDVLEEIKATKKAIGGLTEDEQPFDTHRIPFELGDTFYLSTDGYGDTFGRTGKKLTTKKFKALLLSIKDMSIQEQEQKLDDFIEKWKDGIEQIDDILVIGVRL